MLGDQCPDTIELPHGEVAHLHTCHMETQLINFIGLILYENWDDIHSYSIAHVLWGWPHQEIHSVHLFPLTISPGPQMVLLRIRACPTTAVRRRR